jgi:phospholipid/cholesterol/gamma-HCH transport system substrate-binding protein
MKFLSSTEFKVGTFVVAIAGLIAFMSLQVSDDPSYLGRSRRAWFLLPSASGLIKGSAIRSAGIPIGVIKDIRLQDGQARVEISLKSELVVTRSGSVEVKANGILGDKFIEVSMGESTDPELEDGGQILNVRKGGGLDDVMSQVSEIAGSLKDVVKNLNEATSRDGTEAHILGRIVKNIEKLTGNLSEMTQDNKDQIREIVTEVKGITGTINELVNDESEHGFKNTWKNAMVRIDSSLKNIDEITGKINRGEGTIGKLVSDEKMAEEVSAAVEGIGGMLDSANRVTTAFDFNGYYLNKVEKTKSSIGIQIQPGLDRYYYLGVVNDPSGVVDETNYKSISGGVTTESDEIKTYKNKAKFTAYFAKNFYDFTLKGGLIEDTGGVGVDYSMAQRRLVTSVEAYDFTNMQVRANVSYKFKYGLYVMAGYNDLMNKKDTASAYGGAGLFLTNDDLKLLLTKSPF